MKKFLTVFAIIILLSASAFAETTGNITSGNYGRMQRTHPSIYVAARDSTNADEIDTTTPLWIGQVFDDPDYTVYRSGWDFDLSGQDGIGVDSVLVKLPMKTDVVDTDFSIVFTNNTVGGGRNTIWWSSFTGFAASGAYTGFVPISNEVSTTGYAVNDTLRFKILVPSTQVDWGANWRINAMSVNDINNTAPTDSEWAAFLNASFVEIFFTTPIPRDVYVDATDGDDTNDGLTDSTPYKTLAKAQANMGYKGNNLFMDKGEQWRESFTFNADGTSDSTITMTSYGTGADPIISGSDLLTGTWVQQGATDVWVIPHPDSSASALVFDDVHGQEKPRGAVATYVESLLVDLNWMKGLNDSLYGFFDADPNVTYTIVEYDSRATGITVTDRDYITIDGVDIRRMKKSNTVDSHGIYGTTVTNITITNSEITDVYWPAVPAWPDTGFAIFRSPWEAQTSYGILFDTSAEDIVISNSTISGVSTGIHIEEDSGGASGDVVINNVVLTNMNIGIRPVVGNSSGGTLTDVEISESQLYNHANYFYHGTAANSPWHLDWVHTFTDLTDTTSVVDSLKIHHNKFWDDGTTTNGTADIYLTDKTTNWEIYDNTFRNTAAGNTFQYNGPNDYVPHVNGLFANNTIWSWNSNNPRTGIDLADVAYISILNNYYDGYGAATFLANVDDGDSLITMTNNTAVIDSVAGNDTYKIRGVLRTLTELVADGPYGADSYDGRFADLKSDTEPFYRATAIPDSLFTAAAGDTKILDLGVTIATVTDDILGILRPQGDAYDIGALERVPVASASRLPSIQRILWGLEIKTTIDSLISLEVR